MRNIKDLSDAEAQEYSIDMAEAHSAAIESVIRIADKYGISRDEAMKHFSTVMVVMAKCSSFEGYKLNKEEANENRG
jgi:hypothetical protein